PGLRRRRAGGRLPEGDRRPPGRGREFQGESQAHGLLRRRRHEGDRRQGEPKGRERDPAQAARLTSKRRSINYAASSEDQIPMYAVISSGGKQYRVSEG